MKKLLALPILAILALSSCTAIQSAREKLDQMPQSEFVTLTTKVNLAGQKGGEKLAEVLGDKSLMAATFTMTLQQAILDDSLDVADVIRGIIDNYGTELGLEEKYLDYIRDGAKVIDAAIGQIRLGIDGKLAEREKILILELLDGLRTGLSR